MEGAFFGSVVFEFIGALAKWIYYYFKGLGSGTRTKSFLTLWLGRKGQSQEKSILHGFSNIGLGMLIVVITLFILTAIIK